MSDKPKWFDYAESKVGTHEVPGTHHDEFILACHQTTTLKAKDDETPWCSSFVNKCMIEGGETGTNSAAAASWREWGVPCSGKLGAVVVIRQKQTGTDKSTGSASGFHVGFFVKQEGDRIFLLGGNQSDQVKISSFGLKSYSVAAIRWPKTA